jgi:ABC-type multidrug transport system fused ATPase/permease subunit
MIFYGIIALSASIMQMAPTYVMSIWSDLPLIEQQSEDKYWKYFVGSTFIYIVLVLMRSIVLLIFVLIATTKMHNKMAWKVLRSKILFFDSNPIGRVTSRFSKDQSMLDTVLSTISIIVTQGCLRSIIVAITVSITNPALLVVAILGLIYMFYLMRIGTGPMGGTQGLEQRF